MGQTDLIEDDARRLEREANRGDGTAFARELEDMSPDEIRKVADQLRKDHRQDPSLPEITLNFDRTGNLSSSVVKNEFWTETTAYDRNRHRLYVDKDNGTGVTSHQVFDHDGSRVYRDIDRGRLGSEHIVEDGHGKREYSVKRDEQGNVTEVNNPGYGKIEYKYKPDGSLGEVHGLGTAFVEDHGKWYDKKRDPHHRHPVGDFKVNKDGSFTWNSSGDGMTMRTTYDVDGSTTTFERLRPNDPTITERQDPQGNMTDRQVVNANGKLVSDWHAPKKRP